MPKFVINLTRRPNRLDAFRRVCLLPDVQTFEAIDGRRLDDEDLDEWARRPPSSPHARQLSNGEMGCLLSHYGLWKRCAAGDASHMMIFEDDCLFSSHFIERLQASMHSMQNHSSNVDVLWIGGRFTRDYVMRRCIHVNDHICTHDYHADWDGMDMDRTTHAYVISRTHASYMVGQLESGFDATTPVDHLLTRTSQMTQTPMFNTLPLLCYSPMSGDSDIR